ncbi:AmmeMemoRadiSam system protein A [Desulfovibrio ferrophilus]|uniref:AMMECR1 domain protein n=1 Tax=Desulfovibrio ferrophilus TaxID=241368 RepID=A0A2Z6B2R6_9BACT|nr:AmmeMemoRadiSam system protein A [Desulfovibrio ferrophilus]BBD09809.1 AMMECR1 domain protein [Desulfovibrio ferrophilus]
MAEQFQFSLTDEEKQALKDLVRLSIASRLFPQQGIASPVAPNDKLKQPFGAFVTLHLDDNLRGCIGHVVGDAPLWDTIWEMAQAAAFQDPRFSPLQEQEFEQLELEISILSPLTQCTDPALVEVGRHGLLINHAGRSGLLLPQVPVEWNWSREQFLAQTCHKAGLPPDTWRDPKASIFWFEAEVF